ncbi:MAG: DMT family transporter [Hyphomicrobiaceae bacterium]
MRGDARPPATRPAEVSPERQSLGPYLLLLAMAIGWGGSVSLSTIAMTGGETPLAVAFWSTGFGFLLLTAYLALRGRWPPLTRRHAAFYAVCGLLGTAAPNVLSMAAAAHLPAGVRSILFALIPMMTLALMSLGRAERTGWLQLLGLLLGLAAVLVLLWPGSTTVPAALYPWLAVSLGAVTCYALENVYIDRRQPEGLDPVAALWGMTAAALAVMLAAATLLGVDLVPAARFGRTELAMLGMATVHVSCYASFIYLIGRAGPVFASQVAYLTPPAGILWGVLLLGERLSGVIGWSMALMLLGISLVRPRRRRPDR